MVVPWMPDMLSRLLPSLSSDRDPACLVISGVMKAQTMAPLLVQLQRAQDDAPQLCGAEWLGAEHLKCGPFKIASPFRSSDAMCSTRPSVFECWNDPCRL